VTDLCGDCEWIDVRTIHGRHARYVIGRYCPAHEPPPTPYEEAREILDQIDRDNGL
jgi:hypothetical protein